jgi:hypothetical protein
VFLRKGHEDRKEDERDTGTVPEGLLAMKARFMRLSITLMAIAATALAGGASLKGF